MSSLGESTLTRLLSSKAKGELMVLFHRNPGLMDEVDGIARRIGQSGPAIQGDLEDLVDLGVLGTIAVGTTRVIFLNRQKDKDLLGSVGDYLQGLRRR
ncbi:MAG TPA: hypothetical protein VGR53_09175 [Nitrososphaerales archaeon]|nr:hypothetical protein [Nitrososphaerales archaeon]